MNLNEMINKKRTAFTILEVLTIIAILAMIATTFYVKVGNILDKPKDLEITRDLKQYEDVAVILTTEGKDFTEENLNKNLLLDLQITGGKSNRDNPFNTPYEIEISDKDNFKVTSFVYDNGILVKSNTLNICRLNGNLSTSYDKSNNPTPPKPGPPKYPVEEMVLGINISAANQIFDIPAYGPYNLSIDWGDGSTEHEVTTTSTSLVKVTHSYATPGDYIVRISGISGKLDFNAMPSRVRIVKIVQFGTLVKSNANAMFMDCKSLKVIEGTLENTGVTVTSSMFSGCSSLESIPSFMFKGLNVTNANSMFSNCSKLTTLPDDLFNGCNKFTTTTGVFGYSGVTNVSKNVLRGFKDTSAYYLFGKMIYMKEIDKDILLGTNITNAGYMFSGCTALEEVPKTLFKNTKINLINGAFMGCTNLTKINPYMFEGLNITNGSSIFKSCTNLKNIPDDLFNGCIDYKIPMGSGGGIFDGSGVTEVPRNLFRGFTGSNVGYMFENATQLTTLPTRLFEGTDITVTVGMFSECINITGIPENFLYGSKINNSSYMFSGCKKIASIPGFLFNGLTIDYGEKMFKDCIALTTLPDDLFNGCLRFRVYTSSFYGPFSGTKVQHIQKNVMRGYLSTSASYLFDGISSLLTIEDGIFEGTPVKNLTATFNGASNLTIAPALWLNSQFTSYADCFDDSRLVSNYASIPSNWK